MSEFPNKNNSTSIEKKAKSVEEALSEALSELGISEKDAIVEIVQEPSKGFLGLGAKDAVVKVTAKTKSASVEGKSKPVQPQSAPGQPEPTAAEAIGTAAVSGRLYTSDSPAENAKNFIADILTAMGIDVTVTAVLEEDVVKINLEGENMGIVIGKRGDTLDSLQYLTSLVVNRNSEDYIKISIDTENYREKRAEALAALSNRLAAKVKASGKKFALEPMNPYERRIIHSNLQDNPDVTTFSVGQEPYRKVVIAPKHPKQYGKRGYNKNRRRNNNGGRSSYRSNYSTNKPAENTAETGDAANTATYKADFKPQQHKAEYKNFEEYLAAHSKD